MTTISNVYTLNNALTGNSGYVARDTATNNIIVSVAGSQNIQNWVENLNVTKQAFPWAGCTGCAVESGFYFATTALQSQMLDALSVLNAEGASGMVFTGHSLGAAVTLLTAVELAVTNQVTPSVRVENMGQPRVGNAAWATALTKLFTPPAAGAGAGTLEKEEEEEESTLGQFNAPALRALHRQLKARTGPAAGSKLLGKARRQPLTLGSVQGMVNELMLGSIFPMSPIMVRGVEKALAARADVPASTAEEIVKALEEQAGLTQAAGSHYLAEQQQQLNKNKKALRQQQRQRESVRQQLHELQALAESTGIATLSEEHLSILDTLQLYSPETATMTNPQYHRWTHWKDIVPHLPAEIMGFSHGAQEYWGAEDWSSFTQCSAVNGEDPSCSDNFFLYSINDHYTYLGIPISRLC